MKRPYVAPQIEDVGALADLTRSTFGMYGMNMNMGMYMNMSMNMGMSGPWS